MGLGHRARHVPYDVPVDVADVRRSLQKFRHPCPGPCVSWPAQHTGPQEPSFLSQVTTLTCETIENFVTHKTEKWLDSWLFFCSFGV